MPEPARVALPDEVHGGQLGGPPDRGQPLLVALLLQRRFQLRRAVEVVGDGVLAAGGDDQDVGETDAGRLGHDVLQRRDVDDRQQLLRHRLRGRQEAGAEAGGRDDGLASAAAGQTCRETSRRERAEAGRGTGGRVCSRRGRRSPRTGWTTAAGRAGSDTSSTRLGGMRRIAAYVPVGREPGSLRAAGRAAGRRHGGPPSGGACPTVWTGPAYAGAGRAGRGGARHPRAARAAARAGRARRRRGGVRAGARGGRAAASGWAGAAATTTARWRAVPAGVPWSRCCTTASSSSGCRRSLGHGL